MILAHRGDSFRAPENTLEAAQLGLSSGADGWELDVQWTLDGVPIVLHDESLARTTDVARRFEGDPRGAMGFLACDFTVQEIRTLDAGSWFVDPAGGPRSATAFGSIDRLTHTDRAHFGSGLVRIPTLAEALQFSAGNDWLVNIEIKPKLGDREQRLQLVLGEVRAAGMSERVVISSFDHAIVAEVAIRQPGLATGALISNEFDGSVIKLMRVLGADAIHLPPDGFSDEAHGIPVLVYTVNDARPNGLALGLADRGVAGLFTDDPESLASCFGLSPSAASTRPRWDRAEHRADGRPADPIPPPSRPSPSPEIH